MSTPLAANADEPVGSTIDFEVPVTHQESQQSHESFEVPSACVGSACVRATGVEPPAPSHLVETTVAVPKTVDGKPVDATVVVVKPTILEHKYVRLTLWMVLFILLVLVLLASFKKFKK